METFALVIMVFVNGQVYVPETVFYQTQLECENRIVRLTKDLAGTPINFKAKCYKTLVVDK
jgi:hypothetical protein